MFDQNWLKRYMLTNQAGGGADEKAGAVSRYQQPMTPGLGLRPPLPQSTTDTSPPQERRVGAAPGVSYQSDATSVDGAVAARRGLLDMSGGADVPGVASARLLQPMPPLGHGVQSSGLAGFTTPGRTTPARIGADVPASQLPYPPSGAAPDAGLVGASPYGFGAQPSQAAAAALANAQFARASDKQPADLSAPMAAPATLMSPWAMPLRPATGAAAGAGALSGGGAGFPPGTYGYTPFDGGANHVNLWNYGNESGPKHFVVMCKDDVELRASPTYADDTRIGHFLHAGQVVVIDERRMVNGAWFLHLADGRGWAFESKERLLVMTEAQDFERGLWHYSVVCDDDVETRMTPTYSDDSRSGAILGAGDCIAVDERCSVAGARFLKLADGRGWVFETKDRLLVMSEVRAKAQEARDFARGLWHYTVVCDDDVEIRAAPTYSDEARTGLTVHPGDCVAIDERCRVAAVWYLRLADGRGWIFETKDSRRVMMQLH